MNSKYLLCEAHLKIVQEAGFYGMRREICATYMHNGQLVYLLDNTGDLFGFVPTPTKTFNLERYKDWNLKYSVMYEIDDKYGEGTEEADEAWIDIQDNLPKLIKAVKSIPFHGWDMRKPTKLIDVTACDYKIFDGSMSITKLHAPSRHFKRGMTFSMIDINDNQSEWELGT